MPTFATMQTPNGHLAGEVASALQKSIRRGLERESLYWASELYGAGFGDYAFRRLRIIASEDVGMADPMVAVQVRALSENFNDQRRHNKTSKSGSISGERLFLIQAVLVLVRAPKSRMVDHIAMAIFEGERPPMEMPDWALDKHTARGKRMGRGEDHFFEVGALIENESDLPDPYAAEGQANRTAQDDT
jgi:replication-associated recombination protein RarA